MPTGAGYWLAGSTGVVLGHNALTYGDAASVHLSGPIVGAAAAPGGLGYWLVGNDGGVFSYGPAARFYGSMGGRALAKPIVGMALDPATGGYWLVASDGGVFAFNAPFYGSMGGRALTRPIVGMATTPDGGGYWLVASDGGVFTFGPSAVFHGSTGAMHLAHPIVGMAFDPATFGYWLVASDGGVFPFDAPFDGSAGSAHVSSPVVSIASANDGGGYWTTTTDGHVTGYGLSSAAGGSALQVPAGQSVVAIAAVAAPAWQSQKLPSLPSGTQLSSLSCVSIEVCVAVGSTPQSGSSSATDEFAMTESPQTGWVVSPPLDEGAGSARFSSVSCGAGSTDGLPPTCMAVGSVQTASGSTMLTASWNGSWWTQRNAYGYTPPQAKTLDFLGVSCGNWNWCEAIADATFPSSPGYADQHCQLVELWNGLYWYPATTCPDDGTGALPSLLTTNGAVSCVSIYNCLLVGDDIYYPPAKSGINPYPFAEIAAGTRLTGYQVWPPRGYDLYQGVSCTGATGATSCEVVGTGYVGTFAPAASPFAASWDGSAFHKQFVPYGGATGLSSVSCPAASQCYAVGSVSETWNGSYWYEDPSGPTVPGGTVISYNSGTGCTALGSGNHMSSISCEREPFTIP